MLVYMNKNNRKEMIAKSRKKQLARESSVGQFKMSVRAFLPLNFQGDAPP